MLFSITRVGKSAIATFELAFEGLLSFKIILKTELRAIIFTCMSSLVNLQVFTSSKSFSAAWKWTDEWFFS
jgi:hypothetical protein